MLLLNSITITFSLDTWLKIVINQIASIYLIISKPFYTRLYIFNIFIICSYIINKIWAGMSEIGCLTSHPTILQLYMWRHIDVQADWRRNWTYDRALNRCSQNTTYQTKNLAKSAVRDSLVLKLWCSSSSWNMKKTSTKIYSIHHFRSDLIHNIDHMRVSGTESSSLILSQSSLKSWKMIRQILFKTSWNLT